MTISNFLRDKLYFILTVMFTAGSCDLILYIFNLPSAVAILLTVIYLIGSFITLMWEFFTKRVYFNELKSSLADLEKKRYISEVMDKPSFTEGKIVDEVLSRVCKSVNDEISIEHEKNREYREYIELWVHEIKTPISAAMLTCENNSYTDVLQELRRIEGFVEQALFYARSSSVEKDYMIKQIDLKKLIGDLLKKNASLLISNKIKVVPKAEGTVHSDSKWLTFILQQLIDNAVKYGAKTIYFDYADKTLTVKDDGISIPPQDLPRIFDRGFTGENGRATAKSTGMGLYLCKELCNKLGLDISASSHDGAEFSIAFPENPYVTFS